MIWLPVSFLVTAFVYALVGFGGGSTYAALLTFAEVDYTVLPIIVLLCNIVVVTGGVVHFWRAGFLQLPNVFPLVIASVPLAWLGGRIPISQSLFLVLLGLALTISGALLMMTKARISPERVQEQSVDGAWPAKWNYTAPFAGGALGFFAGLVGIGGGIFLAPLMHHFNVTTPKRIAATASFFILLNSLAGLTGQVMKHKDLSLIAVQFAPLLWLPLAVLIGGQAGTRLSINTLSGSWVKRLTGVLVLFVGMRVLWTHGIT